MNLLEQYRQASLFSLYFVENIDKYFGGVGARTLGPDYELRSWKKETKPVSEPSVYIHQVTANNSMIGINSGSFDVSSKPKTTQESHKGVVVPSVETSDAPNLEYITSHEITPSTSQQFLTSLETSEDIATSHEDTPCPVSSETSEDITTSPKDRLILQETIVKKLDALFETEYTKIESKIILETDINGYNQIEEARFNFFIRDTFLDFVANFRYRMLKVLDREISERTFIIESLSPISKCVSDIKYYWIEKNVASIKEANNMFAEDINPRKTDLLVIR
ncbi:hypothetical protein C1645_820502 [Glomus cerebriforme]|uniref:Uncharacterized protein n=1 Tax=Glomus cerebriforme TaxID=658196 RepID=A0A397T5I8_9GLOM|nr:hypothetical protein C1645_820502 [Glomus cerebriforme]